MGITTRDSLFLEITIKHIIFSNKFEIEECEQEAHYSNRNYYYFIELEIMIRILKRFFLTQNDS